jgi:L-aspartate oxidase
LRHLNREKILKRFPGIYAKCQEFGHDLTQEIPVAPAAHYTVGGIASNHNGRTDIERLYVCGEIAATGIMGANRLASNSLIECLVFANRAVEDSVTVGKIENIPSFEKMFCRIEANREAYSKLKSDVSNIMNRYAGIIRSEDGLNEGLNRIKELRENFETTIVKREDGIKEFFEEASHRLLTVATLIMTPALMRKESRGGHYREDYACADENYAVHSVQQRGKEFMTAEVNGDCFDF